MNRYNDGGNFIAPYNERREAANIGVGPMLEGETIHVGQPLSVHHGPQEQADPVSRALGLGIRLGFYLLLVLVLAITLVRMAGGGWGLTFALFAGISLWVYAVIDKRDYSFSRSGIELHKVDTLAELKLTEMEQTHELRKMVVESQMEMWRAQYGTGGAQITDGGGKTAGRITGPTAAD